MKDNEKVTLSIAGKNEEGEAAPVYNQKYSVETGGDNVDMAVSDDGTTAVVKGKNLEAGAAPVAFRVKGTSTSDKEGQTPLPDCIYDDVVSNPPANAVAFTAVVEPQ